MNNLYKTSENALEVQNLSFKYQDAAILSNIGFTIPKGSFTGIIGPNGSGKTTLLKCLIRLLPPQAGRIALADLDLSKLSIKEIARRVAVVPQQWENRFPFTAGEIVAMGRFPHQRRFRKDSARDREIVRQSMTATHTLHLANRPIFEMSGGEQKRVMIAQALAQSPQLLLLDEPTAALDINHQIEISDLLKSLVQKEQLTVLTVLHDLNLAAQYCDALILLRGGKIFAAGPVTEVLTETNLEQVYQTKVRVRMDPMNGKPLITLYSHLRQEPIPDSQTGVRIHLLGGGGSCAGLFEPLNELGFAISAGALNIMDTDWQTAREFEIPLAATAPFSPISPEAHRENLALIDEAAVVILADLPFGSGNLLNLQAAKYALEKGKTLIVCDFTPISDRDFTGGQATTIYRSLEAGGAQVVRNREELLEYLADWKEER